MAVFDEEEHGGKSDNIPINIEIILRPYREKALQQKNTNTIFDNEKSTFSSTLQNYFFLKFLSYFK